MGLVLWQNQETIRQISARRLDLRCFALALLITQVSLLITFVRWSLLVRVIEPGFTLRCSILLGFIGYLFNLVIPGAVGGDVVKAAYLSRMQIKKTQAIASMVLDRIVGLLGLFLLAATAGALCLEDGDAGRSQLDRGRMGCSGVCDPGGCTAVLLPGDAANFTATRPPEAWAAVHDRGRTAGGVGDLRATARRTAGQPRSVPDQSWAERDRHCS